MAEGIEARATVYLPRDSFDAGVDAFCPPVVVREGKDSVDGCTVEFETVRKGVEVGQLCRADASDPRGELPGIAYGRRDEMCELTYK